MKMTPKEECFTLSDTKRKRQNYQTVVKLSPPLMLANEVVRKFSEMKIAEAKSSGRQLFKKIFSGFRSPPSSELPTKKRKLSDRASEDNSKIDCITGTFTRVASPEKKDLDKIRSTADILLLELPLSEAVLRKLFSQNIRKKIQPTVNDKASRPEVTLQDVLDLFENCVLFLKRDSTRDIDSIVARFSDFGKVLDIQNHWVKAKGYPNEQSTEWAGATVSYYTQEDLDCACKAVSVLKTPMIGVSLVDHLTRIHAVELRCRFNFGTGGTSVVLEGFRHYKYKLGKQCGKYGKVLQIKWLNDMAPNYACEVVYNSTWSAVAAALALDGNYHLYKCCLKARIRMTSKELYIHRLLCEMF